MATVDSTIDGIITNAQLIADKQLEEMRRAINDAENAARAGRIGSFPDGISPSTPSSLALEPPTLGLDQLLALHDPEVIKITEDIDREFANFLNDYFPDFSDLSSETIQWIRDTIASGGEALPGSVEGKIWDRARSREDTLHEASTHEATEAMARRGWSAPPGVLTERLRVAQMENTLRKSSLSRDIAIAQAELAHEMLRFAIQQSVALQSIAMQAASQFVSEYVRAHAIGLTNASSLANAAVNLYRNTIMYYQAFFEQEDLQLKYAVSDVEVEMEGKVRKAQELTDRTRIAAESAIEAAKALGDSAAAALGAQNTMAATVQETTQEE